LDLINEIFERFNAKDIGWISLGTLRFPKGLRQTAMDRFPNSQLPLGEFTEGVDRKERYASPERVDVYERMLTWIRRRFPKVPTYMCMENPAVWGKIFGGKPRTDERLRGIYG
jgi:spore photoproduct lyase